MTSESARMECSVLGVVKHDKVRPLCESLRALSYVPAAEAVIHELIFEVPPRPGGGAAKKLGAHVRLRRSLTHKNLNFQSFSQDQSSAQSKDRWVVRHEGAILRGAAASQLPATIREVIESKCEGSGAPQFWLSLGLKLDYAIVRDGNWYRVHFENQDFEVMVVRIKRMQDPRSPETSRDLLYGYYVVEVTCKTEAEEHVEAAEAIGVFCERMAPYVELTKAHPDILLNTK